MQEAEFQTLVLPFSGKTVTVARRPFSFRDNIRASKIACGATDPFTLAAAKMHLVTTWPNGDAVLMEDILDWPEDDATALISLRGSEGFIVNPSKPPFSSDTSPAGV